MESDYQLKRRHAIGGVTSALYDKACGRVFRSPRLRKYNDILFADWPEGDDHLRWVIRGTVGEIEAWAQQIKEDSDGSCA